MTFDPTKLPPAPFAVSPLVHDSWGWIRDAEGAPAGSTDCSWLLGDMDEFRKAHEYGSPEYERGPEAVANLAEFYAMARNAFDVQIRRPYLYCIFDDDAREFRIGSKYGCGGILFGSSKCPLEAWLKADAHFKEHFDGDPEMMKFFRGGKPA